MTSTYYELNKPIFKKKQLWEFTLLNDGGECTYLVSFHCVGHCVMDALIYGFLNIVK